MTGSPRRRSGRRRPWWPAALAVVVVFLPGEPAGAIGPIEEEVLTIGQIGGLEAEMEAAILGAAQRFGARSATFHRGTLRLISVERGSDTIQRAPDGFSYPMAATAVDPQRAMPLLGVGVADVLATGAMVFGETSARLRGAAPGDVVTLVGWDGATHRFRVGAVVPDEVIGWDEIALDARAAAGIDFVRASYVALWDYPAVDELMLALFGRTGDAVLTVGTRFDPVNPDWVLPTVLVKERFGEFAYRPGEGDRIVVDPEWRVANIVDVDLPHLGPFRCHRQVVPYLEAALAEIDEEGLASIIDYQDFQVAGGCYNPRLIRGGDKGGAVSRHSWGIAIDINPSDNPYGGRVGMDRRFGEIFRRWGFAWGAGWRFTDGGHFEWNHLPDAPPD